MLISFPGLMSAVWKYKYSASAVFIFFVVLSIGYTLVAPLSYEAVTLLLVDQERSESSNAQPARQDEVINSQVRIAQSDAVVRNAIVHIGLDVLYPQLVKSESAKSSLSAKVTEFLPRLGLSDPANLVSERVRTLAEDGVGISAAALAAKSAMKVQIEPKTNLLEISFRHSNPEYAARFANAIAHSFIQRNVELRKPNGTAEFFKQQKQKFELEFELASSKLSMFATASSIYDIAEQRKLALSRSSALSSELASTQSAIAAKEAEIASTARNILKMKPILNSPIVLSMITELTSSGPENKAANSRKSAEDEQTSSVTTNPPLLLVRVYQDAVQAIVAKNAELTGMRAQRAIQEEALARVEAELSGLAEKESNYESLRREVERAAFNAETFAKRAAVEQLESDLSAAKFSAIKIAQAAEPPLRPYFPNPSLILPAGAIVGLIAAVAIALLRQMAHVEVNKTDKLASRHEDAVDSFDRPRSTLKETGLLGVPPPDAYPHADGGITRRGMDHFGSAAGARQHASR